MRTPPFAILLVSALAFALACCSREEAPPGKWEGMSQSSDWLVAVRLQVDHGNIIHATALSVPVSNTTLPERMDLSRKIKAMLAEAWKDAPVGKVEYSGNTITREGGVAPLFVYQPAMNIMTFNFYGAGRLSERVKLYPVKEFMIHG